jgi:hypothetical protein
MDDLRRTVWKGPALAWCDRCPFRADGVWSEQAGKRARRHTRETGHPTQVRYEHTTEYAADP